MTRTKSQQNEVVCTCHEYGLMIDTREIFLHPIFDVFESEDAGTDFRMANKFIKNMRILESINHNQIVVHQYNIGGDWNAGMAIYDSIKNSVCNIIFICHGIASSMGSIIPQAADVRITMPNCDWLIHEGSTDIGDMTYRQSRSWSQWEEGVYEKMMDIYINATNVKRRTFKTMFARKEDWWLSSEEAAKRGFADAVYGTEGYESIESLKI